MVNQKIKANFKDYEIEFEFNYSDYNFKTGVLDIPPAIIWYLMAKNNFQPPQEITLSLCYEEDEEDE